MKKRGCKWFRRLISAFLAAVMAAFMSPVSTFAESDIYTNDAATTTWEQEPVTVEGGEVLDGPDMDVRSLATLYDQYAGYEANYLPSTWTAMAEALKKAETVLEKEVPTQKEI